MTDTSRHSAASIGRDTTDMYEVAILMFAMHSSGALQLPILPRIKTFSSGPGHTIPASCSRRCFSAKSGLKMASMTDSGVLDSCE